MISQFFHKYSTYEKFNQNLIGGLIHKDSICFIEDTRQIYAQGALYAVSANDFKETNRILQLHQKILDEILGKDGTESEQTTFIDNIKEINNFLGGYDKNTTLMEVLDGMRKAIRLEINEVQKDTQDKILDFAIKIDEFTNEVADKISEYDKNIEKIDGLYQSMKTQYTELSVRFTDLQEELLDYKGKVDLLRTQHETFESDTNENFRLQGLRINAVETAINAVDTRFQQVTDKYAEVLSKLNEVEAAGIETRQKINALELSKGMAGGLATLDNSGHVPSVQLPSYVDDILEFSSMEFFPTVGESGKLYLDKMTNKQYRWSGTQYTEIPKTIALGETSSTAYAGDKGKKVTDDLIAHKNDTDNPHNVSKYQIGLSNVDNTSDLAKPISLAVQALFDSLDAELEEKFNDINDDIDDVDSKIDTHISNNSNPHSVTKSQVGLGNVDNTSDINKPISTATQNALNNKVDKITGKGLSTNDFTTELKTKLTDLPSKTTLSNELNYIHNSKAPLASPTFTGTPTAPTASFTVNNTQLATTAFVHSITDKRKRNTSTNNATWNYEGEVFLLNSSTGIFTITTSLSLPVVSTANVSNTCIVMIGGKETLTLNIVIKGTNGYTRTAVFTGLDASKTYVVNVVSNTFGSLERGTYITINQSI